MGGESVDCGLVACIIFDHFKYGLGTSILARKYQGKIGATRIRKIISMAKEEFEKTSDFNTVIENVCKRLGLI